MCTRTRASGVYYTNIIFKRLSFPFILCAVRYHYEHSARDRPPGSPLLYIILSLWAHCAKITRPRCSGVVGGGGWGVMEDGKTSLCFRSTIVPEKKTVSHGASSRFRIIIIIIISPASVFTSSSSSHLHRRSDPFHCTHDYCYVSDGAVAVVV